MEIPLYLLGLALALSAHYKLLSYAIVVTAVGLILITSGVLTRMKLYGVLIIVACGAGLLALSFTSLCIYSPNLKDMVYVTMFTVVTVSAGRQRKRLNPAALPIFLITGTAVFLNYDQNQNFVGLFAILPIVLGLYHRSRHVRWIGMAAAFAIAARFSAMGMLFSTVCAAFVPRRIIQHPIAGRILMIGALSFPFVWASVENGLLQTGYLDDLNRTFQTYFHQNFTSGRAHIWTSKIGEELKYSGLFCPNAPFYYLDGDELSVHNSYLDIAMRWSISVFVCLAALAAIGLNPGRREIRNLRMFFLFAFFANFEVFLLSNNLPLSLIAALFIGNCLGNTECDSYHFSRSRSRSQPGPTAPSSGMSATTRSS